MKKQTIGIITATFLFLIITKSVFGLDKEVVCTDSGCSGFLGPLFNVTNTIPGETSIKTFSIKNEKGEKIDVSLTTDKKLGTDQDFAEGAVAVVYSKPSELIFSDSLYNFIDNKTISLGSIDPQVTKTYEVQLSLPDSAGNEFQGKRANFSLNLNISRQTTGSEEVLSSQSSSSSNDNGNSLIGSVLGLSDTDNKKFLNLVLFAAGLFLLILGIILILRRRQKEFSEN